MNATAASDNDAEECFLQHLVEQSQLTTVGLEQLRKVRTETTEQLPRVLLKLGLLSERHLVEAMAGFSGCAPFQDDQLPVEAILADELNASFLRAHEVIPVSVQERVLRVACWNALDGYIAPALQFATGLQVERVIATRESILSATDRLYRLETSTATDEHAPAVELNSEEVDRLKDLASEEPIIRLVQRVISSAVAARASDIHFEPTGSALTIRFRSDGLLQEVESQPRELGGSVISRVKVMAGLNIAERRLPQDGRIRVTVQGKDIDFRVATSPTLHGESVVLRVLDRQDVALDFDALGFDDSVKRVLRDAIARPYGIILVTGPTGSGKTTTLYAALKEINTPDKKILTVEDPVEYVLQGVNQVPIKPQIGLTFANALRAFLRQDPDVLMVGEIRDRETAEIAVQAALTGHLLFSTLHTNTAAAAVARLLDMGIDDYLLTSTLHVIVGQRLIRKLCSECREPYEPSSEILARFGVSASSRWFRAVGCRSCQGTGYRGRTTIIEALPMSEAIRTAVLDRADAHVIERVAVEHGMRTLVRHGVERVAAGTTSIEEVLRVINVTS